MIEKHTFVDLLNDIAEYSDKVKDLEGTLNCVFENWLTQHESNVIYHLSRAFFDTEDIRTIDWETNNDDIVEQQQENIEDVILYYCYTGEFGKQKEKLIDIYQRGDIKMNATNAEMLYDLIIDYLTNIEEDVTFFLS